MTAKVRPSNPPTHSAAATSNEIGSAHEDASADLPEQLASLSWLLRHLYPPAKILDIGCGTGQPVCSTLADAGHTVLGIDTSSAMISAARQRVPNAEFAQLDDLWTFNPEAGSFHVVTLYFSAIAGESQSDVRDAFGRIYGWLKPGGLFVFATVLVEGEKVERKWMGKEIVVSWLSLEENVEEIKKAGFEVLHEKVSLFTPKGSEAGTCSTEEVWEGRLLFVYARKKKR